MLYRYAPIFAALALVSPMQAQDAAADIPAADPAAPPAPVEAAPEPAPAKAEEPSIPRVTGKITRVALYQGNALITREVTVPAGKAGPMELTVSELPTATDPSSVYADTADGIDIRSVACRKRALKEEEKTDDEVDALDKAIDELQRSITTNRNEIALRRIRQEYLRGLERFVAPAATQEMTHGVLQADELEKVTKMHFDQYETASQEVMQLDFENDEIEDKLADLIADRAKLAAGPPVSYDAVVFLDRKEDGESTFQLNYLVRDCGWSPVYNMRGDSAAGRAALQFNALIHQVSGENWNDAELVLSTASPTVSAYNPRLSPLYVQITDPGQTNQPNRAQQQLENRDRYGKAVAQKKEAIKGQYRGKSTAESASANFTANESAASVQLIELSEQLGELRQLSERLPDEDLSIQYRLPKPISLVSRRDPQMVPVLAHEGPANFYHVATPILTASVFREAELANDTGRDLLGGQVNVYLDGQFTGRTDIPTIARGRRFTLGFGVDGQLRARRVLADRTETVQGGNKQVTIESQVILDNYKDQPVTVRVRERTPHTEDTSSLRLALGTMSHDLSKDSDYLRFERPKGILLWDIPVKPGSGDQSTNLNYAYSLEFDKNLTLREIGSAQKTRARDEFLRSRKVLKK